MEIGKKCRTMAIVLLISLALPAANILTVQAAPRTYFFTATISPGEVDVNQLVTYSVTITNNGSGTLGSTSMAIPAEFTDVSQITILNPLSWNYTLSTAAINLNASGGSAVIQQGENVTYTFSATAPALSRLTTWTVRAYQSTTWGGTEAALQGSQPTVNVVDNSGLVAPEVTATPTTVTQNQSSTLTSTPVTTGKSPYTYQWFQKAPGGDYTAVGGNFDSYVFPGSTITGTWTFLLQVTDSTGASVNSTAVTVNVNPTPTFTIAVIQSSHGTITPGTTVVNLGGTQAFTISPEAGYQVTDVIVDGTSIGAANSYVFSDVMANHELMATLTQIEYTLTVSLVGSGTVTQSPSQITYHYGDVVQLTAIPTPGWRFSVWSGDLANSVNPSSVTIDGNKAVTATFLNNQYTVSAIAGTGGSISPPGVTIVNYGGSQAFTITPDAGYHIVDVLVNSTSIGSVSSYTVTEVTGDTTVTASFAPNVLTITASATQNGSINPNGNVAVTYGSNQGFIISPGTGYHIVDVLVDGISVGAVTSYTFTGVVADHTITASFAVITTPTSYAINVVSSHGSPTASAQVNAGGSFTASVTSPEGDTGHRWICTGYSIDGVTAVSGTSYTFTNVQADHTITFNWQEQYYMTVLSFEGSTSGTGWYNLGATATASVPSDIIMSDSDIRQIFASWIGDATGNATTSTLLTVDGPKTVTATWKTQYLVTFIQNGMGSDATGTVMTVFDEPKACGDLPENVWVDASGLVSFSYAAIVESTEAGKRYVLASTNSTSPLTLNEPVTIRGSYELQLSPSGISLTTLALLAILLSVPPSLTIPYLLRRGKSGKEITPIAEQGGSISPSTKQTIERGGDSTIFIITAHSGYKLADVVIDKTIHLGPVRTYKFFRVIKNHTISAIFHKE